MAGGRKAGRRRAESLDAGPPDPARRDTGRPGTGRPDTGQHDDYVEEVLALVERIPPGRVMSYGAIAEYLGRGGPRQVGTVMSHHGGPVPWHRVVAANGRLVPGHEVEARRRHAAEGTPFRGERVDMPRAAWWPDADRDPGARAPGGWKD